MSESNKVTLLLVDDEPRNLDALEAILEHPDYRLCRADNADKALRVLLEHDVAAIILDIRMPGVTGFELAQLIKGTRKFRQIPILFLTAYAVEDQDQIAGYGAGAVDYLTKPINPQILRLKVAIFADLFRKTRALAELNERLEERVRERTSELERSEAALKLAARQKDEFLAILAHELRNPLAPLRTGLDLLLQVKPALPAVDRTLNSMNRQLDHMVRLIDDLLDMSRINTGKLDLKKARVDLAAVIDRAIDGARPFLERRRQTITVDVRTAVWTVADEVRVVQVLGNLLHNASKFTPEGGSVRVELSSDTGQAVIRVIDTGVGIPQDQVERVFEMFAHSERGTDAERGLGIGLALARSLTAMHGGTLVATSAGTGRGTTFTLTLPVLARAGDTEPPPVEASMRVPSAASLRIVLVEDNEDIVETLADWLQLSGHEVRTATDGTRGIELVRELEPDVVLCDLGLEGIDGLEVCRRIRAAPLARQPIMVAVTGWGRDEDRTRTREAGFDHHMVKPLAPNVLRALLSDCRRSVRNLNGA
jgi:signal transduction histidine kinase